MKTMKFLTLHSFLLALVIPCVNFAQQSLFSFEEYISEGGDTLNYRQLISDYSPEAKYPLVIFLHGLGERGNDNEAQLKWGVMNFASDEILKNHQPSVLAPQCPSQMTWGNFNEADSTFKATPSKPMELLLELIDRAKQELPVDSNRIYITGLSMGGIGTFDALLRRTHLFAAAVPVCGISDPTKAAEIAHIPTWIFHGALDAVIDPIFSQKMLTALTKAGANPGYTQYPKAGHFAWVAAYDDMMMMHW